MPKTKPISEVVRQRAIVAVATGWELGCPVAGSRTDGQAALADVCLRRYFSLDRRGVAKSDRNEQIHDLAMGMVEASGQTLRQVGPLIREYEWLAEQVLTAITTTAPVP